MQRGANAIDDIGRKVAAMAVRSGRRISTARALEAIETGEEVARLAGEWRNPGWLNLAQYSLGQAYFIAGRLRDAEQMLGQACSAALRPGRQRAARHDSEDPAAALLHDEERDPHHVGRSTRPSSFTSAPWRSPMKAIGRSIRVGTGYSGRLPDARPRRPRGSRDHPGGGLRHHAEIWHSPLCPSGRVPSRHRVSGAGRLVDARKTLADAREEGKVGRLYSIVLRTSIYLAQALSRLGDVPGRSACCAKREIPPRQQGFSGLEAEALLGEATIPPASNEAERNLGSSPAVARAGLGIERRISVRKPLGC